jgi:hypothetical protein
VDDLGTREVSEFPLGGLTESAELQLFESCSSVSSVSVLVSLRLSGGSCFLRRWYATNTPAMANKSREMSKTYSEKKATPLATNHGVGGAGEAGWV